MSDARGRGRARLAGARARASRCSAAGSRTTTSRSRSTASAFVLRVAGKDTDLLGIDRTVELAATRSRGRGRDRAGGRRVRRARGLARDALHRGRDPPLERMREPGDARACRRGAARVPRRPGDSRELRLVPRRRDLPRRPRSRAAAAIPEAYEWAHEIAARIERERATAEPRAVPQRPPERELPRRRRAPPHRRLGVRGHGRPLLRPRELLDQPRARRDARARCCSRRTSASSRRRTREALELMRFMSDFREAMWGVVQAAVSELDFDFDALRGRALRAARAHGGRAGVRRSARRLNARGAPRGAPRSSRSAVELRGFGRQRELAEPAPPPAARAPPPCPCAPGP